jgi:hypothetical protein
MDLYRAAGFPEEQLKMFEQMRSLQGPGTATVTVVVGLACAGYVLYLRKYFAPFGGTTEATDAAARDAS